MGGDGGSGLALIIELFFKYCIRVIVFVAVVLGLLSVFSSKAEATEIGIHTVSVHVPGKGYYNNNNFGGYVWFDNDVIVGGYYNTYSRPSFYVAKHWELGHEFGVALGLVSGYQRKYQEVKGESPTDCGDGNPPPCHANAGRTRAAIGAMFMFSYALPKVGQVQPRIWFLPPITKDTSTILHLTLGF